MWAGSETVGLWTGERLGLAGNASKGAAAAAAAAISSNNNGRLKTAACRQRDFQPAVSVGPVQALADPHHDTITPDFQASAVCPVPG